jgi:DNA-binding response OmpR family regulator
MGGCVVVLEDDEDLLGLMQDMLALDEHEIIGVSHSDLLEERIAGHRPDVFLIDIMLKGESGIEVAERLRRTGFEETPLLALSASSTMVRVAEGSGLFTETIRKPFELASLLETVSKYVRTSRERSPRLSASSGQ